MAQTVKNPPGMRETWVQSWVEKIPWRREWLATHSSILAWRIPWTEEPGRMQSMGLQRRTQEHTHTHTHRVTVWLKVAQLVKNPPSKQETWVRSLG